MRVDLGKRLTNLRNRKKWTQEEVSTKLDIKRARYSSWENNNSQPDLDMVNKIVVLYGVTIDYLLGQSDDPNGSHKAARETGPEFIKLQRAFNNMTTKDKEKAVKMIELAFEDAFNEDD